jgi:7-keto-8-aminopelargonate synthetase-like enzyme
MSARALFSEKSSEGSESKMTEAEAAFVQKHPRDADVELDRSLTWGVYDHQDGPSVFAQRYAGLAADVADASAKGVWQYFQRHRKYIGQWVEVEDEAGRVWRGVNGASQDYLGLSSDPRVIAGAKAALDEYGAHSSGSAPMGGGTLLASRVEGKLATALGLEHVCLFPTGWAAGYGSIYGLVRPRDHIVIDGLAHNCLQHGALASTKNVTPFIHNDMESLRKRLERIRRLDKDAAILIVSEGLFSMDSDSPDFGALIALKNEFAAQLLLDVAHDFGSLGPDGRGLLAEVATYSEIDYVMGSFSKSFASIGGFFASNCLSSLRAVQGYSGCYTFSNYLIPPQLGAIDAALDIVFSREGDILRAKLLANSCVLQARLSEQGLESIGRPSAMTIIVAGAQAAGRLAYKYLLEAGVVVNCIEFPAVRKHEARFRIQLTPRHSQSEIASIADGVASSLTRARIELRL